MNDFRVLRCFSAVALLCAACGGDDGPVTEAFVVDTLPNGRTVARNVDGPAEAWTLTEQLRIGSIDGVGADVFGQIRDVEIGPDGDLYVLDSRAGEVRVFAPDGTHLRTIGREGQGPGELNRASGLAFGPEGRLWVVNIGNARYSAFDPASGELMREERRLASFFMLPFPGGFDDTGRLLDVGLRRDREPNGEPVLLRLDADFAPADTLVLPRADERYRIAFRRDGQMYMSTFDPFAPRPTWALHPEGGVIIGEGDRYRLHRVGFSSDTSLTIVLSREPVPVTGAERDSALAAFRELRDEVGARPDRDPQVPRTKPAHGVISVDDRARIWVRRTTTGATDLAAWDLFESTGRRVGQVTGAIPATYVPPTVRGDRLVMYADADGVPTVFVYEIRRSEE